MNWRRTFLTLTTLALAGCGNGYYQGPVTDHFNGQQFDNPWAPMPDRFGDFLKWRFTAEPGPWPTEVAVETVVPAERVQGNALVVTYIGHATVLLQTQGLNILTDPIWAERASPVGFAGPKRVAAPGVTFDQLPPIDLVLVSHNHYDHLNLPTLAQLEAKFNPVVLTPLGNDRIIQSRVPAMTVYNLDWYESYQVNDQVKITLLPMQHWSARGMFDRREALWGAFVIEAPGGPIYFLADAGYAKNLSEDFLHRFGQPRLSLLPIGAYEPEWFMQYAHMTPAQAVQTYLDLGSTYAMGTQYEVFPMADEAYTAPRDALTAARREKKVSDKKFMLPKVGEQLSIPPLGKR